MPSAIRVRNAIVTTIALIAMLAFILFVSGLFHHFAAGRLPVDTVTSMPWTVYFPGHFGQLLAALVCIAILSRGRLGEFGLRFPTGPSYVGPAVAWGIAFGLIMTAVDYSPNLLHHTAPNLPLTQTNIAGWLSFEALWAGTVEEVAFRGLLVTFLMRRCSGRVRLAGYDMHAGGVIVALIFALAHVSNFWTRPLFEAAGQQVYAFALAVLYAYWYEKSGSVLAPIIGHNLGNTVEYALAFAMAYAWR